MPGSRGSTAVLQAHPHRNLSMQQVFDCPSCLPQTEKVAMGIKFRRLPHAYCQVAGTLQLLSATVGQENAVLW